jgi:hypothetical protein
MDFLVPFGALAKLVRGKFRAALARCRPDLKVPDNEGTLARSVATGCRAGHPVKEGEPPIGPPLLGMKRGE